MADADLSARKRRILFRAKHRGMKEMDLLLGRLADELLEQLDADGVAQFEQLLDVPDAELMDWIAGAGAPPPELDGPLLARLRSYRFDTGSYGENL